jgi:CysZ protein
MFKDFFAGVFSYGKAIKVIHQRKLWSYFLLPGIISVAMMLVILVIIWFTFDDMGDLVIKLWPWERGKNIVEVTGGIIGSLILIGTFALTLKYTIIIALGPFLSPLSEKVEKSINQRKYDPNGLSDNVKLMGRGLTVALSLMFFELLFTIPLYILMLIPGSAVVLVPLIFIIQSYYAGRGNMDFILERRFNVRPSLRMSRKHKWLAIGNGVVYMFLISTIIGVFFAPILSVVGLTIELVNRLDAEEEVRQELV